MKLEKIKGTFCLLKILYVTGAFYWTLGNIRPKYRSTLKVIQLYALVETEVMKRHENALDKILLNFKMAVLELVSRWMLCY